MPLPQQLSADPPGDGANDALATVADSPAHQDFASAFGDAFLYMPDEPEALDIFPAPTSGSVGSVELPFLELPYRAPSAPDTPAEASVEAPAVAPAVAPAAKKPRRPRAKSKSAEPIDALAMPAETDATAPAAKKPRRSRAKSKTAEPPVAEALEAEAPVAEASVVQTDGPAPEPAPAAPITAKRGGRRKTVTAEGVDTPGAPPKPRRRKTGATKVAQPEAAQPEAAQPEAVQPVSEPAAAHPQPDRPAPEFTTPSRAKDDTWVDLFLETTPPARKTDQWVDLVLEPTRIPPPRPRPAVARVVKARDAQARVAPARVSPVRAAQPTIPAGVKKVSAPPSRPPVTAAPAPTRWWLVVLALLLAGGLAIVNRPGRPHAPLPAGVLGLWTTEFWKYEKQTLELLPDTVVLTLDGPEERRYPITRVETTPAGRETAVKIAYRLATGDERELDFLADQDPTTALRFRAHTGLVWTRPEE